MKNIISVLQDVSALVTHGSDIARTEVRRIEAQREHKAAECRQSLSNQPAVVAAQVVEHIQGHHRSGLLSTRVRRFWATRISVCRTAIMGKANNIF